MSDYLFGTASRVRLDTCHQDLIKIGEAAIAVTPYDFSIIEGYRLIERQKSLFERGLTHIDGVNVLGNHNYDPSRAFDFQPWPTEIDDVSCWKPEGQWRFLVIVGVILAQAKILGIRAGWGGDWDGDGTIKDQKLHDLPHIELRSG